LRVTEGQVVNGELTVTVAVVEPALETCTSNGKSFGASTIFSKNTNWNRLPAVLATAK